MKSVVYKNGFTLIELSIVLVIIGLIVGGVLVGKDLIETSKLNATTTQLQKYNQAVNTFRDKYGGLPGDLNASLAAKFGFVARAGTAGRGDGNGVIAGDSYVTGVYGWSQNAESLFFWEDLSAANLIEGKFNTATDADVGTVWYFTQYFPEAKLGNGNYIYVNSGGIAASTGDPVGDSQNYYGISVPTVISGNGNYTSKLGLTVKQAYSLDKKLDDGVPTTGTVFAYYSKGGAPAIWAATNAASPSSTTCFDTTSNQYSITQNNGNGVNCALSFKFQ